MKGAEEGGLMGGLIGLGKGLGGVVFKPAAGKSCSSPKDQIAEAF